MIFGSVLQASYNQQAIVNDYFIVSLQVAKTWSLKMCPWRSCYSLQFSFLSMYCTPLIPGTTTHLHNHTDLASSDFLRSQFNIATRPIAHGKFVGPRFVDY